CRGPAPRRSGDAEFDRAAEGSSVSPPLPVQEGPSEGSGPAGRRRRRPARLGPRALPRSRGVRSLGCGLGGDARGFGRRATGGGSGPGSAGPSARIVADVWGDTLPRGGRLGKASSRAGRSPPMKMAGGGTQGAGGRRVRG